MSLTDFSKHREKEIKENPSKNLDSIQLKEDMFYFSDKGSDKNGNFLWESIEDDSFKLVTLENLYENEEFMSLFEKTLKKFEIEPKLESIDEFRVAIRNLYDESLGFDLPFTMMNSTQFNKEYNYLKNK